MFMFMIMIMLMVLMSPVGTKLYTTGFPKLLDRRINPLSLHRALQQDMILRLIDIEIIEKF